MLRRAAIVWLACACAASAGELRIDFLDVGQGDAALVTSPSGRTLLVDGGPPEAKERLVARLQRLGRPIDLVLLSHRHADHLGGLPSVIEQVGAARFVDAPFPHPTPLYAHLVQALADRHVAVTTAAAGRTFDLGGGATLTLLGPPEPALAGTRSDVNANSVVARVDCGALSVLFAGDAEEPTERWLLARAPERLRARVLKVAHHGSHFASTAEFVAAVRPELAIVSVGRANEYGHPSEDALARLRAAGARVYRTDEDGEISLVGAGDHFTVTVGSGNGNGNGNGNANGDEYVASRRSPVFHRASCAAVPTIAARNRIRFAGRAAALRSGRRPAGDCAP